MGNKLGAAPRHRGSKQRQHTECAGDQHADGHKTVALVLVQRQIAILTGQHQLVEDKTEHPEGGPHKEEQPERLEGWRIVVGQSDHRPLTFHVLQHQGRHNGGDPHRLDGQKGVAKLRSHLLHHEQDTCQRRIEGCRQTARRTGGQQGVTMLLG